MYMHCNSSILHDTMNVKFNLYKLLPVLTKFFKYLQMQLQNLPNNDNINMFGLELIVT